MSRAVEYRDDLAAIADEHGFTEGHPMRASLMLSVACGWLEAKDKHIEFTTGRGLGLAGRGAEPPGRAPGESQRVIPLRGREGHSHAERGTR